MRDVDPAVFVMRQFAMQAASAVRLDSPWGSGRATDVSAGSARHQAGGGMRRYPERRTRGIHSAYRPSEKEHALRAVLMPEEGLDPRHADY